MIDEGPRFGRAKQLLEAVLGDELVALDTGGGQCFGFNAAAADIWRLVEQPQSLDQIVAALTSDYEVDEDRCRAEVSELLDDLVQRGLLERTDG